MHSGFGRVLIVATVLICGSAVFGGEYQRTRDGRTTVWNDNPKPGDAATWFGNRDKEGYANGVGTLTWYKLPARETERSKPVLYARYFGNMAHGKFEGTVNVHSQGKTAHALFVDGARTTRWTVGRAPSFRVARRETKPAPATGSSAERRLARTERPPREPAEPAINPTTEPEAPAEGPPPSPTATPKPERAVPVRPATANETKQPPSPPPPAASPSPARKTSPAASPAAAAAGNTGGAPAARKSKGAVDDAVQSLVRPPSTLRSSPVGETSPSATPQTDD